jgi:hypothetical protein
MTLILGITPLSGSMASIHGMPPEIETIQSHPGLA